MTEIKMEEATCVQVAKFLPDALVTALDSYNNFMKAKDSEEKSKNFKGKHDAAKKAVAHIMLLVKLAGSVNIDLEMLAKDNPDLKTAMEDYKAFLNKEYSEAPE